jgi:hypothetical protein
LKLIPETTTLVIVGKWNRYVLSSLWVSKNLFKVDKMVVEIALGNELPPRYTHDAIRFLPSTERVLMICLNDQDDTLKQTENISRELIRLLPHTPIIGLGNNFGYIEKATPELLNIFDLPYNNKFGNCGYTINKYVIQREVNFEDSVLNLLISQEADNIRFDLNFHYTVKDASSILQKPNDLFVNNRNRGLKLIKEVFGAELETQGD